MRSPKRLAAFSRTALTVSGNSFTMPSLPGGRRFADGSMWNFRHVARADPDVYEDGSASPADGLERGGQLLWRLDGVPLSPQRLGDRGERGPGEQREIRFDIP